jgi:hypothetical protein
MKKAIVGLALVAAFLPVQARALQTEEILAMVAMPLAVAAVAEIPEVPVSQLVEVVTMLNEARVGPVQFVEVVRYVPVALVEEDGGRVFIEDLRVQRTQGVTGSSFVEVIEERLRRRDLPDVELDVVAPRVVYDARSPESFLPPIVRTRMVERRNHPHGGPPGQLKKDLGLQTGAEVVHGQRGRDLRGRDDRPDVRREDRDRDRVRRDSTPGNVVRESAGVDDNRGRGSSNAAAGKQKGGGKPPHAGGGGKGRGEGKSKGNGRG